MAEIIGYISAPDLARDMGISRARIHQLIDELATTLETEVGVLVGTTRLLSRGEAKKLRDLHAKKRQYTKSA